jgi:hypothetical protein
MNFSGNQSHGGRRDPITKQILQKFRVGKFVDQEPPVQRAWLFCMTTLMGCINSGWARVGVQRYTALGKRTTPSDEALLSWYLTWYVEEWTKEVEEEEAHYKDAAEGAGKLPKRFKRKVQHFSRTKLSHFLELEKEIKGIRRGSTDWDDAIMASVLEQSVSGSLRAKPPGELLLREESAAQEGTILPGVKLSDLM